MVQVQEVYQGTDFHVPPIDQRGEDLGFRVQVQELYQGSDFYVPPMDPRGEGLGLRYSIGVGEGTSERAEEVWGLGFRDH